MAMYTRETLEKISEIVQHELEAKHWGTVAPGNSPSGAKRFYIFDYRGLGRVTGIYRYKLKDDSVAFFYRGRAGSLVTVGQMDRRFIIFSNNLFPHTCPIS